jgi:hypothetical protein
MAWSLVSTKEGGRLEGSVLGLEARHTSSFRRQALDRLVLTTGFVVPASSWTYKSLGRSRRLWNIALVR